MSEEAKEILETCFVGKTILSSYEPQAGEVVFVMADGSEVLMQYPERVNIYFSVSKGDNNESR